MVANECFNGSAGCVHRAATAAVLQSKAERKKGACAEVTQQVVGVPLSEVDIVLTEKVFDESLFQVADREVFPTKKVKTAHVTREQ